MVKDTKKKEVMKMLLAKKGKGGPGSGSVGQYSIDDPTKAAANLDGGGVDNPTKPTPNDTNGYPQEDRTPNGKGGPGLTEASMKAANVDAAKKGTLGVGFGEPGGLQSSAKTATSPSRFSTLSKIPMSQAKQTEGVGAKRSILKNTLKNMQPLKTKTKMPLNPIKTMPARPKVPTGRQYA